MDDAVSNHADDLGDAGGGGLHQGAEKRLNQEGRAVNKPKNHYSWWKYIKEIIWLYPERISGPLSGVACWERDAVTSAITSTEHMMDGMYRMKVIKMVHWDRTHTLEGAAQEIPCSRSLAAKWQREFFEEVARNRSLLD